MILGTFKFFNERKGFGFVSGDNGTDYFAGRYEVEKARLPEPIERGLRVSFVPRNDPKGKGTVATELRLALGEVAQ